MMMDVGEVGLMMWDDDGGQKESPLSGAGGMRAGI